MGAAAAAWTGVAIGVGALYEGYNAGKQADKALGSQADAARRQADISQQELDLAKEKWSMYKEKVYPMEIEAQKLGLDYKKIAFDQYKDYYAPLGNKLAKEAMDGVEAQPERAARDARIAVDSQFDNAEGQQQRNLQRRGVRPGAGNYNSGIADNSLNKAAASAFTVNRAIEGERDRAEDVNFNRMAIALGRTPTAPSGNPSINGSAGTLGMGSAGRTAGSSGNAFGDVANTYGNAAAGMASGGIQLGMQAYDLYNKYSAPASSVPTYQNTPAAPTNFQAPVSTNVDTGFAPTAFANGGKVDVPAIEGSNQLSRGQPNPDGGQVNGPSGYDNVPAVVEASDGTQYPAKLTNDEYVIPADVVAAIGTDKLDDIIESTRERKMMMKQPSTALTRRNS